MKKVSAGPFVGRFGNRSGGPLPLRLRRRRRLRRFLGSLAALELGIKNEHVGMPLGTFREVALVSVPFTRLHEGES